jgi:hypothetical protein
MIEIEILVPNSVTPSRVPRIVENACATEGLVLTLKSSLVTYPGSIHWHCRKGKKHGTLEITWWPAKRRLWFKVARNRRGEWIEKAISHLKTQIESEL